MSDVKIRLFDEELRAKAIASERKYIRRSRHETLTDVMGAILRQGGVSLPTRIMHLANMSHGPLMGYVDTLVGLGAIDIVSPDKVLGRKRDRRSEMALEITQKGRTMYAIVWNLYDMFGGEW